MVSSYDPIYCLIRPYWSLMHGALIWCEAQRMSSAMWPFCIQQFHHQHSACLRHNMPMSLIQNHLRENIFWCDNYMYVMYCFPYLDYTPRLCMYIAHCRLHIADFTLHIAGVNFESYLTVTPPVAFLPEDVETYHPDILDHLPFLLSAGSQCNKSH